MNPFLFKQYGVKGDFHMIVTIATIAPEKVERSSLPYDRHESYRTKKKPEGIQAATHRIMVRQEFRKTTIPK